MSRHWMHVATVVAVAAWAVLGGGTVAGEDDVGKSDKTGGQWSEPVDKEFKADLDKTLQKYVEMLPKKFDADEPHDLMIALHGHGSDRWQYIKQERGECKGARDAAAKHNMIYVSPDYRATASWMGPAAEADMVQLIALLRKQHKVRRVYLVGGSMGGTSCLIFTALHPDLVDAVVSSNGTANMMEYENFQDAIAKSYGGDKKTKSEEYKKRSPELGWKRFKMPVAFTVGGKDTSVPPDSVRRLYAQLQKAGKKDVLMIDRENTGHSTNYDDTVTAIEFVVKAAAKAKPGKAGHADRKDDDEEKD
ncbi:MAG: alpha/beta fold hydrolase [Planctomycetes bacterium]|nr:alpha/beta fold hydrolase [Planctomycetota bacterium]